MGKSKKSVRDKNEIHHPPHQPQPCHIQAFLSQYPSLIAVRDVREKIAYVSIMRPNPSLEDAINMFMEKIKTACLQNPYIFSNVQLLEPDLKENYRKIFGRIPDKIPDPIRREIDLRPNIDRILVLDLYKI